MPEQFKAGCQRPAVKKNVPKEESAENTVLIQKTSYKKSMIY